METKKSLYIVKNDRIELVTSNKFNKFLLKYLLRSNPVPPTRESDVIYNINWRIAKDNFKKWKSCYKNGYIRETDI